MKTLAQIKQGERALPAKNSFSFNSEELANGVMDLNENWTKEA